MDLENSISFQIQLIKNLHFKIRLFPFFSTLYCWNGKAYESAEIELGNMGFVRWYKIDKKGFDFISDRTLVSLQNL